MWRRIVSVLILAALLAQTGAVVAATGGTGLVLPSGRTKPRSGLRLAIDTHWVSGSGYRPIVVRISPILGGPAPAERFIDVLVRPRGWYPGAKAGAAMATVHLEQGANQGEVTIDVPQTSAWNAMDVEAYEGGRFLDDLKAVRVPLGMRFYYDSMDGTPSILILHRMANNPGSKGQLATAPSFGLVMNPTLVRCEYSIMPLLIPKVVPIGQPGMGKELNLLPDVRVLAGRFPMSYYNGYVTADRLMAKTPTTDSETMRLVSDLPFLGICSQENFPDRWLSLSGVDVIFASLEELRLLAVQYPEKLEVLRTWLSTGTMLCVYGVGSGFANMSEVESLLEISRDQTTDDPLHGWSKPKKSDYKEDIKGMEDTNNGQNWWLQQANVQRKSLAGDSKSAVVDLVPPVEVPFVHRAVGQGRVVAIAAENPFPGTERDWSWLFNSVATRNWLWYQRHGLSYQNQNQQFWNFLIADIGRAPVVSFLTLITLFAVVIGPVNYFVLHRRGRLYLLLVTVPAGAMIVTFALFLYATLADGLGTRARVRSFTQIDQKSGRTISWSRQMYYAGLAPSRGLVFPESAAVYPIDYEPMSGMGMTDTSRKIVWGADQNFVSGYFISRTPSQLLVVEPKKTSARIVVAPADGSLKITNQLGSAVTRVIVCDRVGDYWTTSNLATGATTPLTKTTFADEKQSWMRIHGESRLRFPIGFNPANLENISGFFSSGARYGSSSPPTVESSVLETAISENVALKVMRPNSYMALVERPPMVSVGVDSAEEKSGFHLVVGSW